MQRSVRASRLMAVSEAVGKMAPVLWGHYPIESVRALELREETILDCGPHTQPFAI